MKQQHPYWGGDFAKKVSIMCPNCLDEAAPVRELGTEEKLALSPFLENKWEIVEVGDLPTVIMCDECGWFEVLYYIESQRIWYQTAKSVIELYRGEVPQ